MNVKIAPSILSADFSRLAEALEAVERGGADLVHLDVMDGHFVPNITIGAPVVRSLRRVSSLPFDCHLMVSEPQRHIDDFLEAGAQMISIHLEADPHLHRALSAIREGGAKGGIAINPASSAELLGDALDYCDYVLVMSVNPGFGGQRFITSVIPKITRIRGMIASRNVDVEIEVDGGIDVATARSVVDAGASILVAGSAIFGKGDPVERIRAIRMAATTSLV
ncbi:MAG TPA: ribulose-phosphate 3-epimerase [Thermoanaerobaculia bacterium]|nr:ribulose-phosphate 3-epimerase [Thermoanaerobaculia bacterium]